MSVEQVRSGARSVTGPRVFEKLSFEQAVLASRDRFFSITLRICSSFQDAEDVFQDALSRAFRSRDTYDPSQSALTTWFRTIARNCAIDNYRKMRTRVRGDILFADLNEADPKFGHDAHSSEEIAVRDNTYKALGPLLQEGLHMLSPEQRSVLELLQKGHTHSEIADIQDEPLGTIKSRVRLARARFEAFLLERGVSKEVLYTS